MARRKHEPPPPANDAGSPVFETEADAERYIVDCVQWLQDARPPGERGRSVSKGSLARRLAVMHSHIDLDSLDRYLVNLLSDGRLGVTAGRWWVRRKAPPILVLGLLVLLTGCGESFGTAAMDGVAGAPPAGTGGEALGSAGAPPAGTGGAALGSAGAPPAGTGGAALGSAGAASAGVLVTAGSPGLPVAGSAGSDPAGERWPACLATGCGSSCRTLVGPGWCSVMASCLADNGCSAYTQPNCTGCSALPDGIDCECSPCDRATCRESPGIVPDPWHRFRRGSLLRSSFLPSCDGLLR
jgi:hypothetical protein